MASRRSKARSVIRPLEALEGRQLLARAVGLDVAELLARLVPADTAAATTTTSASTTPAATTPAAADSTTTASTPTTTATATPATTTPSTTSTTTPLSPGSTLKETANRILAAFSSAVGSGTDTGSGIDTSNFPAEYAAAKTAAASSKVTGASVSSLTGRVRGQATAVPGTLTLGQATGNFSGLGRATVTGTVDFWNGTGKLVVVGSGNRAYLLDVTHVDYQPQSVVRPGQSAYAYHIGIGYSVTDATLSGPKSGQVYLVTTLARSTDGTYRGSYSARFDPGPG